MIAPMTLSAVAQACGGVFTADPATPIDGLTIDSRAVRPGDLFVALDGARVDGHAYLDSAAASGAVAALVERPQASALPQIVVADTAVALGQIAAAARAQYQGVLVGITGSAGKTTAKNLLAAILSEAGRTVATEGNLNNELGVPLSLARLDQHTEFAVLEMGAGKPGDIAYLQRIVRPSVAVLLTVAPAHIEFFGSLDAIADTKAAILDDLPEHGLAVINGDLPWSLQWRERAAPAKVVTFGFNTDNDYHASALSIDGFSGTRCTVHTPRGNLSLQLALPGRQGIANALAAIAVGDQLGLSHGVISGALARVEPAVGRGRSIRLATGVTLVDDSYNANPKSVAAAIDVLAASPGPRRLVLGSMLELGEDSDALHEQVGAAARTAGIEELWVIGESAAPALAGFGDGAQHFANVDAVLAAVPRCEGAGTVVVKASRGAALDVLVRQWSDEQEASLC